MNKAFIVWALSQFKSLTVALVKNSRVREEDEYNADTIADILGRMETCAEDIGISCMNFGNFVFTCDKKTRKVGILNVRTGKYVTAHCSKDDFFDLRVGLGVCWAKHNNVVRPKVPVRKKLSELKSGECFIFDYLGKKYKYEFIGTTDTKVRGETKYVCRCLYEGAVQNYLDFFDDICIVWE
jgi:hypothetical protein